MQCIDEAVDVPIAMETLVPTNQTSQNAEEVQQVHYRDKVIDVPFVLKLQETIIQKKEQKRSNVIRTWCFDLVVEELVVVQEQALVNQKVQKKIEVPQGFGANRVRTVREVRSQTHRVQKQRE